MAIDNRLSCRVEFLNDDLSLPLVTDIFFSILDDSDEFVLRAKKMVIETEQELIVKSGETETRYSGRDGRITTKAKYVTLVVIRPSRRKSTKNSRFLPSSGNRLGSPFTIAATEQFAVP